MKSLQRTHGRHAQAVGSAFQPVDGPVPGRSHAIQVAWLRDPQDAVSAPQLGMSRLEAGPESVPAAIVRPAGERIGPVTIRAGLLPAVRTRAAGAGPGLVVVPGRDQAGHPDFGRFRVGRTGHVGEQGDEMPRAHGPRQIEVMPVGGILAGRAGFDRQVEHVNGLGVTVTGHPAGEEPGGQSVGQEGHEPLGVHRADARFRLQALLAALPRPDPNSRKAAAIPGFDRDRAAARADMDAGLQGPRLERVGQGPSAAHKGMGGQK